MPHGPGSTALSHKSFSMRIPRRHLRRWRRGACVKICATASNREREGARERGRGRKGEKQVGREVDREGEGERERR